MSQSPANVHPTHRSLNWVWDLDTLAWVPMKQPLLQAESVVIGGLDALAKDATLTVRRITAIEYDGSSNPIYIGLAPPGSAQSASVWQIRKLTFDVSNNVTAIRYAGGASTYTNIWDNRAGLSYS